MAGLIHKKELERLVSENTYTPEMLRWLADELKAKPRAEVIATFAKRFKMPFSIGRFSRLQGDAGGKLAFIAAYGTPEPRVEKASPFTPEEEVLLERALMWWEPSKGSNPYASAAIEVNKARKVCTAKDSVNADMVENLIEGRGGVRKFLLSVPDFRKSFANADSIAVNAQEKIYSYAARKA